MTIDDILCQLGLHKWTDGVVVNGKRHKMCQHCMVSKWVEDNGDKHKGA